VTLSNYALIIIFAARFDNLLKLIPARLTALSYRLVGAIVVLACL